MGLHQNGFLYSTGVFQFSGITAMSGCVPSALPANKARTGASRNITAGEGITDDKVGIPLGYRNGGAWVMPQKAGHLSAHNTGWVTLGASAAALSGKALEGSTTLTISTNTPAGQLIVSGTGSTTLTISTNTPLLTASLGGTGSATLTISTNTPILGAEASLIGEAALTLTGTLVAYAVGHMEGTTEEAGLTNAGVANSVWSKVIEAGYSADQILRIIAASVAGSATGLEGANPQFTGLDGSTVRIDGTYAAGTRTIDALNGD